MIELDITPVPKPRMTQSDKWHSRPATAKYWAFKEELNLLWKGRELHQPCHIIFKLPMPSSWSKKKRLEMVDKPHLNRPDVDNLLKAFQDALFDEDGCIHDVRISKVWSNSGQIIIKNLGD